MALFGLHVPTFGPLHPIIGKLLGSTGLTGFTDTRIPFGNASGGLTDDAHLYFDANSLINMHNMGIRTTAPSKSLEVNSVDGNNFRLTYNDDNGSPSTYTDFLTNFAGDLRILSTSGHVCIGADASSMDFSHAGLIVSCGDSSHTYSNCIGIVGEALAEIGFPAIGVGGVAKGVDGMPAYGVAGRALPEASASTGACVGVEGLAEATHAGGSNISFWASATNGLLNYSFYGNTGNMYNMGQFHIDDKIEFTETTEYIDLEDW